MKNLKSYNYIGRHSDIKGIKYKSVYILEQHIETKHRVDNLLLADSGLLSRASTRGSHLHIGPLWEKTDAGFGIKNAQFFNQLIK